MKKRIQGFVAGVLAGVLLFCSFVYAKQSVELVERVYNNIKITLNGNEIVPKDANGTMVEPFIIDGTTYLPVRALATALNLNVDWDGQTKTVVLADKNDTSHTHSFSQYICTQCGIHDKEHTYEFLIEYVKHFGTSNETLVQFDVYGDGRFYLTYDIVKNKLYFCTYEQHDLGFLYSYLALDTFFYGVSIGERVKITGFLDAKNYKSDTPLSDVHYEGATIGKYEAIEYARASIDLLVYVLHDITTQIGDELQLTMSDIGFASYTIS